jgi:hypothetical protein
VMHPSTILSASRLQLMCRIACKAPPVLLDLVCDCALDPRMTRGWSCQVWKDLRWLALSDKFGDIASGGFKGWLSYAKACPKFFKREVKRFARLRIANIEHGSSGKPAVDNAVPSHACDLCEKSFASFQQLSLHRFKLHGAKNCWRLYVGEDTHCRVCLKLFWNRERLINHIRYRSSICKYNVQFRGFRCSEEEAVLIDQRLSAEYVRLYGSGKRRHTVQEPVIRLQGPMLPVMIPEGSKTSPHHILGFGHNHYS